MQAVPTHIVKANEAFDSESAQLMKEHRGEWVAYHDGHKIGIATTRSELLKLCSAKPDIVKEEVVCICIDDPPPPLQKTW